MHIDIKLSGYRCFSPQKPAVFELREDILALIGINNSGKSALLRSLYELRDVFVQLSTLKDIAEAVQTGLGYARVNEIGDPTDIFWHHSNEDASMEISLPEIRATSSNAFWRATIRLPRTAPSTYVLVLHGFDGSPLQNITSFGTEETGGVEAKILALNGVRGDISHLLKALGLLARCFYCPSVRHATPFAADTPSGKLYDIYVGKPFIEAWNRNQQGGGKEATEIVDSIVSDIQRLFRYNRLSIHSASHNRDLLIVANGKSLRLTDLGTGISQFIVLLGNIAFAKPTWILIDEPETNLHPALQLQFVQAVAARAGIGVIFATHSIGLARQVADRIYTFSQIESESIVKAINETPNLAQLVGELSFGRIDFSARKLLLVEGQHDVLTFEAFLSAVNKEHEFAIIALGGRSGISAKRLPEFHHILALNLSVFAIIDSERDSQAAPLTTDRADFVSMCEKLGIPCHVLERRAIENYFTERAILVALGKTHYRQLDPYESLKQHQHHWHKRDNWRIARALRWEEIKNTDLGTWLQELGGGGQSIAGKSMTAP